MKETQNLYKVTLKGMTGTLSSNTVYGISYVVAMDSDEAYKKVRRFLDDKDIGFTKDRCLDKIELLASSDEYPECKHQLFI